MTNPPYEIKERISAADIAASVSRLGAEISAHYRGTDGLVLVGLLRGSFIFCADLARALELPVVVDFIEAASYGDDTVSSRDVRILKDLAGEIRGRDVLIVEDIVDTGRTLSRIVALLRARQPKSLEICTLLDKPSRREVAIEAKWVGFEIPDEFVVGYGCDYAQRHRELPYIGVVRFLDGSTTR
ncbi:MAG: hypoxanthine phosphoribosyltransferase [Pseudomonadota bacterium]